MKCDVCQQGEASVFLTEIVNGKMKKVNLCLTCSKAKEVNDPTGFGLVEALGLAASSELEMTSVGTKCPVCGFSQNDFKKTGRFGCSHCYDVFGEQLAPMLKNMHKGTAHIGKKPVDFERQAEQSRKLQTLRDDLHKAVEAEEYEKAADLRDQLRQLETGPLA